VRSLLKRIGRLERPSGVRGDPEEPARPFDAESFLRQVGARSKLLGEPIETTMPRMLDRLVESDRTFLLALLVEARTGIKKPNFFVCDCLKDVISEDKKVSLETWREAEQLYRDRYGHEPAPSLEPKKVPAD
jgi:hypothetical protein